MPSPRTTTRWLVVCHPFPFFPPASGSAINFTIQCSRMPSVPRNTRWLVLLVTLTIIATVILQAVFAGRDAPSAARETYLLARVKWERLTGNYHGCASVILDYYAAHDPANGSIWILQQGPGFTREYQFVFYGAQLANHHPENWHHQLAALSAANPAELTAFIYSGLDAVAAKDITKAWGQYLLLQSTSPSLLTDEGFFRLMRQDSSDTEILCRLISSTAPLKLEAFFTHYRFSASVSDPGLPFRCLAEVEPPRLRARCLAAYATPGPTRLPAFDAYLQE